MGTTVSLELTELAGRPHTPEYASPEQISGEPLSTASDIYSLGVVLYELVAGTRPYKIRSSSSGALEAAILETDPAPPSASAPTPSQRKVMRGDLDTIVLKALKKNPAERYATVNALGDDLRRWLEGLPVLARPDSVAISPVEVRQAPCDCRRRGGGRRREPCGVRHRVGAAGARAGRAAARSRKSNGTRPSRWCAS